MVYIVMTEKAYPKRLAFGYLGDLHAAFVAEVTAGGAGSAGDGAAWKSVVGTVDKPYALQKFDRTMARLRKEYADPSSNANGARLKEELADVQAIMRRNIGEVLERGEKLEAVSRISSRLVSESKKYRWGARRLNVLDMYKRYGPPAAAALLVSALLYWRFFW